MDGMGAAYNAGRWNPVGVKMVYCADSLALAILELRVHLADYLDAKHTKLKFALAIQDT